MGNPLPVNLASECRKADKILKDFVDPVNGLDRIIPLTVLRRAKGFAIFSIFRVGFLLTARAGSGVVVAKLPDGSWSAPSALGIGGIGGGFSAGAEVTDFIVVLNSRAAVKSFMATGSLQLGGNLSLAVGPLGRSAEAAGSLSSGGGVAAMFSYSKSQGLFGGVSLEGTILVDRSDANGKAYHRSCSAKQILSGSLDVPAFAMGLIGTIERLSLTGAMSQAQRADEIEPGAGRDSWSMDEGDRESFERYEQRRGGNNDTGLENYFSQAEIDSRQRKAKRATTPLASSSARQDLASRQSPRGPSTPSTTASRDPFAAAEDEDDDPAYSVDRENALRNAGTYGFSPGGGGSLTNSPNQSRGGKGGTPSDYSGGVSGGGGGRQRSGSRGGAVAGYFDDLLSSNKESRSYSPLNGKRPTMGHRKSSSTFSLPRFGKTKTPPPDALLNGASDYGQRRDASSSSADEELRDGLGAMGGGSGDYSYDSFNGSASSSRPAYTARTSSGGASSTLNGGLKKMTPAEAVLAAASSRAASGGSKSSNSDAFGDLWETERDRNQSRPSFRPSTSSSAGLDALDRELQRNGSISSVESLSRNGGGGGGVSSRPSGAQRHSSYGSVGFSDAAASRPKSSSPKFGFRSGSAGRNRASPGPGGGGLLGSFRTGSGGPSASKAANWMSGRESMAGGSSSSRQRQTDVWAGFEDSAGESSEDEGARLRASTAERSAPSSSSWRPPSRTQSTTPRASASARNAASTRSPFNDDILTSMSTAAAIQARNSSLPLGDVVDVTSSNGASGMPEGVARVVAAFDFAGQERDDLSFSRGDVIVVLTRTQSTNDWWLGRNDRTGGVGSFPANFVEEL